MVQIQKANGEEEEFSRQKLLDSIQRAGVPKNVQQEAVNHITKLLYPHMPTSKIYKHITEFLENSPHVFAKTRYSLKQAIMDLGPTGYPFEDYIAHLLQKQGFQTQTRQIVMGQCVTHEIDIVATKMPETIMVEAKFHNGPGIKTDIHVAFYTWARFLDVKEKNMFTKPLLVTNTKVTTDALSYAQCVGMQVLGWSYPEGNSLRELVEKYHLFPLTVLSSLPTSYRQDFAKQGIVLCMDFCENPNLISQTDLPEDKKKRILDEAQLLCRT